MLLTSKTFSPWMFPGLTPPFTPVPAQTLTEQPSPNPQGEQQLPTPSFLHNSCCGHALHVIASAPPGTRRTAGLAPVGSRLLPFVQQDWMSTSLPLALPHAQLPASHCFLHSKHPDLTGALHTPASVCWDVRALREGLLHSWRPGARMLPSSLHRHPTGKRGQDRGSSSSRTSVLGQC